MLPFMSNFENLCIQERRIWEVFRLPTPCIIESEDCGSILIWSTLFDPFQPMCHFISLFCVDPSKYLLRAFIYNLELFHKLNAQCHYFIILS